MREATDRPRWTAGARARCTALGALVLLSSIAAGCFPRDYGSTPYVLNLTRESVVVQVRRLAGMPDCDLLPAYVPALDSGAFGPVTRYALAPGGVLPLPDPDPDPDEWVGCGAASVRIAGVEHRVQWRSGELVTVPEHPSSRHESAAQAIQLEGAAAAPRITIGARITVADEDPAVHEPCESKAAAPLAWSGLGDGVYELRASHTNVDGCLQAELARVGGGSSTAFLCLPPDAFPFVPGDIVDIANPTGAAPGARITSGSKRVRLSSSGLVVDLIRAAPPSQLGSNAGKLEAPVCAPVRDGCGTYAVPALLPFAGVLRSPGDDVDISASYGRGARGFVGRTERVVLAGDRCTGERPGDRVDLVLVHGAPAGGGDPDGDAGPADEEDPDAG